MRPRSEAPEKRNRLVGAAGQVIGLRHDDLIVIAEGSILAQQLHIFAGHGAITPRIVVGGELRLCRGRAATAAAEIARFRGDELLRREMACCSLDVNPPTDSASQPSKAPRSHCRIGESDRSLERLAHLRAHAGRLRAIGTQTEPAHVNPVARSSAKREPRKIWNSSGTS